MNENIAEARITVKDNNFNNLYAAMITMLKSIKTSKRWKIKNKQRIRVQATKVKITENSKNMEGQYILTIYNGGKISCAKR